MTAFDFARAIHAWLQDIYETNDLCTPLVRDTRFAVMPRLNYDPRLVFNYIREGTLVEIFDDGTECWNNYTHKFSAHRIYTWGDLQNIIKLILAGKLLHEYVPHSDVEMCADAFAYAQVRIRIINDVIRAHILSLHLFVDAAYRGELIPIPHEARILCKIEQNGLMYMRTYVSGAIMHLCAHKPELLVEFIAQLKPFCTKPILRAFLTPNIDEIYAVLTLDQKEKFALIMP